MPPKNAPQGGRGLSLLELASTISQLCQFYMRETARDRRSPNRDRNGDGRDRIRNRSTQPLGPRPRNMPGSDCEATCNRIERNGTVLFPQSTDFVVVTAKKKGEERWMAKLCGREVDMRSKDELPARGAPYRVLLSSSEGDSREEALANLLDVVEERVYHDVR